MWNMHCFPRNLQGPLGVPHTNLVQSVQLFTTSLGLERKQYYRQPVLHQVPGGSLGVPGSSLGIPGGSLESPWAMPCDSVPGVALEIPKAPLDAP